MHSIFSLNKLIINCLCYFSSGYGKYDDVIIGGDLENLSFIAYYCRGDKVVSLASLGKDPAAANYAEMLQQGKSLTKQQVMDDGEIALKLKC